MSPDLKRATAFVDAAGRRRCARWSKALNRAAPLPARPDRAARSQLRAGAELSFAADRSFDAATRSKQLLHGPVVARDLADDDEPRREDDDGA